MGNAFFMLCVVFLSGRSGALKARAHTRREVCWVFAIFGKIVSRGWPIFVAGWIVLLAAVWWSAPPWREVAEDREFGFLPEDTPSRRGETLFQRAFPGELLTSNVVLVVN